MCLGCVCMLRRTMAVCYGLYCSNYLDRQIMDIVSFCIYSVYSSIPYENRNLSLQSLIIIFNYRARGLRAQSQHISCHISSTWVPWNYISEWSSVSCVSPFMSYTPAPHPRFVCTAVFKFELGHGSPLGCKFELLIVQHSIVEKSGMYAATFYDDMYYVNNMCFT